MTITPRTKRLRKFAAIAALLLLGVSAAYGPPWFWRDFAGWDKAAVVRSLGPPLHDSRVHGDDKPGGPHTLGWYHGAGMPRRP